ncbi:MAG: POTRA domain-containing protein, partial [Bacteroidota bacterium]
GIVILLINSFSVFSQITLTDDLGKIDYSNPQEYEIGAITISGVQNYDNTVLTTLSGLAVGDKIKVPGEKITKALDNLWKQSLFEDIKISASKIVGTTIFLDIFLSERPKLSRFSFTGVKKSEADKLRDEIKLSKGDVVTDNVIMSTKNKILNYFIDKGFLFAAVDIVQKKDTITSTGTVLYIHVNKGKKIKINKLNITGVPDIKPGKLKRSMKKTKEKHIYRLFATSRFSETEYKTDKTSLIEKLNEAGFRDAKIEKDSVYKFNDKSINVDIDISQGHKYYFRDITWIGNTIYTAEELNSILKIKKGDIFNQSAMDANLYMNIDGRDISSLYLDDGYLFFSVTPVEVNVENDSIDLEIRIYEGKQAVISKVTVTGNTKTNDNVVMREIRSKPGQLFSRSDIIRTQRELAQLRYFNEETLAVNPIPNAADGTVDIEYVVEETSSDQVELSGGWGAGRIVGTLGLSFNNFSARNFFKKGAWRPLPSGDGQKLSLRAQSNGIYYQSYNASFTEPWLGGKKPNALSVSAYHSVQTNGVAKGEAARQSIVIDGISVELGKRLKWPDDFFNLYLGANFQLYRLENFSSFSFQNGRSNNFYGSFLLSRNSYDYSIYPRSGSEFSLQIQATPPYSFFGREKDYDTITDQEKYKWLEYHKWKVGTSVFTKLAGNLVLNSRAKFGFLGYYNKDIGPPPFERFYLGGDGLSGFALDGREIIGMRGYSNNSLTQTDAYGDYTGGIIFNKYTLELRYLISPNPMATIYVLGFMEAGNTWSNFKTFNPFDVKRSAGAGIRIYLPMFGLLGLDWGYGFDDIPGNPDANKGQFHFSINQSID